ncbi:MAG TPA: hypothetical protein PK536_04100 [Ignavibacteria bacterium]|nr:hypothetical protein [Ignavibacteria bacterium]HRJ98314.1 hypothetical protein [Ignavibacteria bacterium]
MEINSDEKIVPNTAIIVNPEIEEVLPKPEEGKEYVEINLKDQEIVNKNEYEKLLKENSQLAADNEKLKNLKTPDRQQRIPITKEDDKERVVIPGERNK